MGTLLIKESGNHSPKGYCAKYCVLRFKGVIAASLGLFQIPIPIDKIYNLLFIFILDFLIN